MKDSTSADSSIAINGQEELDVANDKLGAGYVGTCTPYSRCWPRCLFRCQIHHRFQPQIATL
jgi:hypothetical protein